MGSCGHHFAGGNEANFTLLMQEFVDTHNEHLLEAIQRSVYPDAFPAANADSAVRESR